MSLPAAITLTSGALPWLALFLPAAVLLHRRSRESASMWLLPAFIWATGSWITGDRELYFACSLSLAMALMLQEHRQPSLRGSLLALTLIIEFLLIRYLQQATGRVLLTEALSAVGILVFAVIAARLSRPGTASRLYVILLASLLSCWTLAI